MPQRNSIVPVIKFVLGLVTSMSVLTVSAIDTDAADFAVQQSGNNTLIEQQWRDASMKGFEALRTGNFELALEHYSTARELFPDSARDDVRIDLELDKVTCLLELKRWDEARLLLKQTGSRVLTKAYEGSLLQARYWQRMSWLYEETSHKRNVIEARNNVLQIHVLRFGDLSPMVRKEQEILLNLYCHVKQLDRAVELATQLDRWANIPMHSDDSLNYANAMRTFMEAWCCTAERPLCSKNPIFGYDILMRVLNFKAITSERLRLLSRYNSLVDTGTLPATLRMSYFRALLSMSDEIQERRPLTAAEQMAKEGTLLKLALLECYEKKCSMDTMHKVEHVLSLWQRQKTAAELASNLFYRQLFTTYAHELTLSGAYKKAAALLDTLKVSISSVQNEGAIYGIVQARIAVAEAYQAKHDAEHARREFEQISALISSLKCDTRGITGFLAGQRKRVMG